MTEQEYINTTNLARLRAMKEILHLMCPNHESEKERMYMIFRRITEIEDLLNEKIGELK